MSEETPLKLVSLKYADDHYKGGVGELSETSTVNCDDGSTPTLKQYVEQHGGEVPVSKKAFDDHVGNEDANAKHLSKAEKDQLEAVAGKNLATTEWASGEFANKTVVDTLSGDVTTIEDNYVGSVTGNETGVVQVAFTTATGATGKAVTTAVTVTNATQDSSTKELSGDGLVTGKQAQDAIDKAVETEKTRAEGVEATLTTAVTNAAAQAAAAQTAVTNLSGTADTDSKTDTDGFVTVELKGTVGDHSLSVSTANIAKADEVSAALNTKQDKRVYNKFVVVGVYGQSNAVGYDESPLTKYDIPVDANRVKQYSDSLKPLTFCAENLQNMNIIEARNQAAAAAMASERVADAYAIDGRTTYTMTKGIHLPLANLICSVIPDDYGVIIVPGAYGGKAISQFLPNTNYYNEFKSRIKSAMALNADNVFAGIVWCQGESDTGSTAAATYKQNFESIINTLHTDMDLNEKQMPKVSNAKEYWFAYEWPLSYKQLDSKGILDVQREVLGATNYVDIPDETPANTTDYCAQNPAHHFGKDSFRKVIAPRVFAKMQEACMFQNVEFYGGIDSEEIAELETTVEKHSEEIAESEAKVQRHKDFINILIDKINQLAAKHPGEVDPVVITYDVTKSYELSPFYNIKPIQVTATSDSMTLSNGGGWHGLLFDESITHFECTVATPVGTTKSIAIIVAEDPNDPGSGAGMFLQKVGENKYGRISSTEKGFNTSNPGASWNGHDVTAGDKLTVDISGDTVKVVLRNNDTDHTIFDGSVSDGLGGETRFNKPRLGIFGSWSSTGGAGTINFTNVKLTSDHV